MYIQQWGLEEEDDTVVSFGTFSTWGRETHSFDVRVVMFGDGGHSNRRRKSVGIPDEGDKDNNRLWLLRWVCVINIQDMSVFL